MILLTILSYHTIYGLNYSINMLNGKRSLQKNELKWKLLAAFSLITGIFVTIKIGKMEATNEEGFMKVFSKVGLKKP